MFIRQLLAEIQKIKNQYKCSHKLVISNQIEKKKLKYTEENK